MSFKLDRVPIWAGEVVDQRESRPPPEQPDAERDPVHDLDHRVAAAAPAERRPGQTARVHGQPVPAPEEPDPTTDLVVAGAVVGRAADRHVVTPAYEPLGDVLDVLLGAATVGVAGVSPGQEGDVH